MRIPRRSPVLLAAAAPIPLLLPPTDASAQPDRPAAPGKPIGFDAGLVDKAGKPCAGFLQDARRGEGRADTPPGAGGPPRGRFNEVAERNQQILKRILEAAAAAKKRDAVHQKIGDYYASCMDEPGAEGAGISPLAPAFARIAKIADVAALATEVARLQPNGVGVLFRFDSTPDFDDARQVIAEVDQGGLGLPDRA